jgi:DNA-binding MarR family transcriptional regulator
MIDASTGTCSCGALRQAARHATRLYDSALSPSGLGLNQYSILSKLDRFGPKNLQELANILVMDRSTLGHLLRPLEARGLVAMKLAPKDRRSRIISLTASGSALMRQAKPLWAKAEAEFQRQFGADAAQALRQLLNDVIRVDFGASIS